jgi:hypothetical protein
MCLQVITIYKTTLGWLNICITIRMEGGSSKVRSDCRVSQETTFHLELGRANIDILQFFLGVSSVLSLLLVAIFGLSL